MPAGWGRTNLPLGLRGLTAAARRYARVMVRLVALIVAVGLVLGALALLRSMGEPLLGARPGPVDARSGPTVAFDQP